MAKRERRVEGRRLAAQLLVMTAIGAGLGAMGPFGSYAAPAEQRLPLWMANVVLSFLLLRMIVPVGRWLAEHSGMPSLAGRLIALTVGMVPLAILIDYTVELSFPDAPAMPFALRYLQTLGIGVAIHLMMNHLFPGRPAPLASMPAPMPELVPSTANRAPTRPRFFDRLPGWFGSELYCLNMEDHYVRAHGPHGSTLILMRLRDALAELDVFPGMQVHRSWWVGVGAVDHMERENGASRLVLVNGLRIPVARSYEGAVRAQRWNHAINGETADGRPV